METFLQDVRFGLRALVRAPGLTAVAVLSLGIGIAANTTVFTWLRTLVTKPMPAVAGYDRLAWVHAKAPGGSGAWSLSYPEFKDLRAQSRTVDVAATGFTELGMRLEGASTGTERIWAVAASDNYFDVLRVPVVLGRGFQRGEEDEAAQVAVLGYAFWRHRFHADSSIIGRSLVLNGRTFAVIGVAAPRFGGTIVGLQMDMFVPVTTRSVLMGDGDEWRTNRGWRWLDGVARLRPGVTFAQARAEVDATGKAIARANGQADYPGNLVRHMDEEGPSAWFKPVFPALLGITAVVLLIACANVANLLLARAATRRREIAIRLAVGAGRMRLVRQLMTESLTLALMAGVLGMLLTLWGRDGLSAFVPAAPFPIALDYRVDGAVVAFALLVTVATALVFGLAPALQASRPELVPTLKDDVQGAFGGRHRLQSGLVVSQVSLSLVSLVCAGLFVRSLLNARLVDVGFRDPEHVLLVSTDLQLAGIRGDSAMGAVMDQLLQRVRALPGVTAAGIGDQVPLGFGGGASSSVEIEGYQPKPNENMSVGRYAVTSGYFDAMRIPVTAGRAIQDGDERSGARNVVVNQAFVNKYWPGLDPIGRWVAQGGGQRARVVGVVRTGKYYQISEDPQPVVFQPAGRDRPLWHYTVHVRTAGDPNALVAPLRDAFRQTSADLPFLDVRTMAESMGAALFNQRIAAYMLTIFGVVAVLLSAMGLYGVMAYTVTQRTREIGVRVALGAGRRDVVRLVLGRAVRLAGLGLGIGLVVAFVAARLLRSLLYGVGAADPATFASIVMLLGAVAVLAGWLPARRAARVDPMIALRYE